MLAREVQKNTSLLKEGGLDVGKRPPREDLVVADEFLPSDVRDSSETIECRKWIKKMKAYINKD